MSHVISKYADNVALYSLTLSDENIQIIEIDHHHNHTM